jgi:hypothetical protein
MRFMVEIDAGMEKANSVDASGGPGAMLAKLGESISRPLRHGWPLAGLVVGIIVNLAWLVLLGYGFAQLLRFT